MQKVEVIAISLFKDSVGLDLNAEHTNALVRLHGNDRRRGDQTLVRLQTGLVIVDFNRHRSFQNDE